MHKPCESECVHSFLTRMRTRTLTRTRTHTQNIKMKGYAINQFPPISNYSRGNSCSGNTMANARRRCRNARRLALWVCCLSSYFCAVLPAVSLDDDYKVCVSGAPSRTESVWDGGIWGD